MDIPTIRPGGPTAARTNATIDQLADAMVRDHGASFAPLASYSNAFYGNNPLTLDQRMHALIVASHAVTYCPWNSQFERRRLAMVGLRTATNHIGDDMSVDRLAQFATLIAEFAEAAADSYRIERDA